MKLIDKNALVAEIKRLIDCCYKICAGNLDFLQKSYPEHYYSIETYKEILSFIDTLEVKEVDLEKELNDFIEEQKAWVKDDRVVEYNNGDSFNHIYDLESVARHFFELGMHVSNKAQKGEKV